MDDVKVDEVEVDEVKIAEQTPETVAKIFGVDLRHCGVVDSDRARRASYTRFTSLILALSLFGEGYFRLVVVIVQVMLCGKRARLTTTGTAKAKFSIYAALSIC